MSAVFLEALASLQVPITVTEYITRTERVFFRSPRTNRKRIVSKWKKRLKNWKSVKIPQVMFVMILAKLPSSQANTEEIITK